MNRGRDAKKLLLRTLAWPSLSFTAVGAAYLGLGPSVFGKRLNGTMAWYTVAPLLPYLLLSWLTWHVARLAIRA